MSRTWATICAAGALSLGSWHAQAQPAPELEALPPPSSDPPGFVQPDNSTVVYEAPQQGDFVPPAPPKPAEADRAAAKKKSLPYVHDRFYMRVAPEAAYMWASLDDNAGKFSSFGAGFSLAFGGSPLEGLAVGGRIGQVYGFGGTYEALGGKTDLDARLRFSTLQVFGDIYPNPSGGFHILVAAGLATLNHDAPERRTRVEELEGAYAITSQGLDATGMSATAALGWEGWLGEEFSLGALGGITWSGMNDYDFAFGKGAALTTLVPHVALTATYH